MTSFKAILKKRGIPGCWEEWKFRKLLKLCLGIWWQKGAGKISEGASCTACPGKLEPLLRASQPQQRCLSSIRDMENMSPKETWPQRTIKTGVQQ